MTDSGAIPHDKIYFKIGEVARIVGVKPYVLRYWETEFSVIRPGKTRSKHRLYRKKDVETLMRIKVLLHDRRFTIEGARKQLRSDSEVPTPVWLGEGQLRDLNEIREGLLDLRRHLTKSPG